MQFSKQLIWCKLILKLLMLALCLTEEEQGKDQEKWKHIEKSLKSENYSNALQLVDEFLTKCKSPDFSFQALMKKAQTCLDAWQDTRKLNSLCRALPLFFTCTVSFLRKFKDVPN